MARAQPLQCPFCDNLLARPVDIRFDIMELTGGICKCSAIYVFDRTGHNLGAAFMDALTFACKEDYDKALSLLPEEYETACLDYDLHANTASAGENSTRKSSKLFFVKLKKPS